MQLAHNEQSVYHNERFLMHMNLHDNCQTPAGYCNNGVCTPTGMIQQAYSWLLTDGTEANEVIESGSGFHSVKVLAAKDF